MRICLATAHCKPAFIPLALLYLHAHLVERQGIRYEDIAVLEFGPDAAPAGGLRRLIANPADPWPYSTAAGARSWSAAPITLTSASANFAP